MGWLQLDRLCDGLEAPLPSPAGGSAAAVAAAMAASLVVMVGRGSPGWNSGLDAAESAAGLRERLLELGAEDVEAVAAAIASSKTGGDSAKADAWSWATRVPAEIAERAADVAVLAVAAAQAGKRPMRADAEAAGLLAMAATRIGATIVAANLASGMLSAGEAHSLRNSARQAAERAGIGPELEAVLGPGDR
jgi:formiminotetrahydrofolate cyclodeaminase